MYYFFGLFRVFRRLSYSHRFVVLAGVRPVSAGEVTGRLMSLFCRFVRRIDNVGRSVVEGGIGRFTFSGMCANIYVVASNEFLNGTLSFSSFRVRRAM